MQSSRAVPQPAGDWILLTFAAAFAVVFLLPPFTPFAFAPDPQLRWGDVLDFATPVVMLPMYWLVLSHRRVAPVRWEMVIFLVLGAIWIEGQGVHLAANAIGHHPAPGAAHSVTELFDEKVGHLLWHGAALALAVLIVVRGIEAVSGRARSTRLTVGLAALVYGFAFFLIAVEGATAILVAAGSIVIVALALRDGPRALLHRPTAAFFGGSHTLTLVLLGAWFVYWGGRLPEFSSLGLIK
jgi:hypothetical protein